MENGNCETAQNLLSTIEYLQEQLARNDDIVMPKQSITLEDLGYSALTDSKAWKRVLKDREEEKIEEEIRIADDGFVTRRIKITTPAPAPGSESTQETAYADLGLSEKLLKALEGSCALLDARQNAAKGRNTHA